jgi:hypothetical protein
VTPSESQPGLAPLPSAKSGNETLRPSVGNGLADYASTANSASRAVIPDIQYVRDRQVAIDFEVERKGPSGVKIIEVYYTENEGRTWKKYWDTTTTAPPLQLPLPERECTFGIRLVLYSGVNQSEGPPQSGDRPDLTLCVDRTAPQVEMYAPTLDPSQPNALLLRYKVSDANLDPRSVKLEWSHRPNGDWRPVAASEARPLLQSPGVKECSWVLPPDITDSVYLRLRASDLAGNTSEFITRDPQTVDLQKPTAKVKGIVTGQRHP